MPVPYAGELFTFTEPDGSEIELRGFGNQFQAVFETPDGYSVTVDPGTGFHTYATPSADGSALVSTGATVGAVDPQSLDIPLHARPSGAARHAQAAAATANDGRRRWEIRREERRAGLAAAAQAGALAAPPAPTAVGDVVGLCLLVAFPDVPAAITRQQVDDFCNLPGHTAFGNNGSVYDYFLAVSAGRLRYRNSVIEYFTAAHPRAYYTDPAIPYGTRAQELIREGLDHLKATGYDFGQLSTDAAHFVYALNIFYAGPTVNAWSQGLWPHSWALATQYVASATRTFSDYQITDIGTQLTLRTFCHENGHMVCDFPDLYDYGSESAGVGNYCLMCNGGSNTNPVHVSGYLKNVAGWATSVRTLDNGMIADVHAGQNDFLIHRKNATEYFLLENRQQTGRDSVLPDAGLAIWHVDELGSNSDEQMTAAQHYELSLEQADHRFDLEHNSNAGDATDLYGAPDEVFDTTSAPDSRWWDGGASGLDITAVSAPGPVITVRTKGLLSLVVPNFGAVAGGWRVDRHPRFTADLTGDGCADIVGFGDAGVYVAVNHGDGSFGPVSLAVPNFGYVAGGWRTDRHPRMLADLTGDGCADIVGFGDAGVYVALNNGNGTFGAVTLVVPNFGAVAGGWRTDRHPRMLADLTGNGRADIVGFGDAGVYVALNNGN
ncbi:MAG: M6 family metalloprotease domain-containing protein, partial [Nakamurella sp.]